MGNFRRRRYRRSCAGMRIPACAPWPSCTPAIGTMRGWERLEYSVRTGKTALDEVYGKPLWEHFKETPAEAEVFNDAMTALSTIDSPAVAEAYPFDGIGSVVDVAGGHGLLLATILARNPNLKGTLFDAPHVIAGAKDGPLQPFLSRCTLVAATCSYSVPPGADAYMMKHIIHDWPDEHVRQTAETVPPGSGPRRHGCWSWTASSSPATISRPPSSSIYRCCCSPAAWSAPKSSSATSSRPPAGA